MAPVTSRLNWDGYADTLTYLKEVQELPQFYKDLLNNQWELDQLVHLDIQQARPVRPLNWGNMINPQFPNHTFTANKFTTNVLALFIFVTGEERGMLGDGNACGSFRCSNVFNRRVVPTEAQRALVLETVRSSCASCLYNQNNTRCAFNTGLTTS